jgi:integrase
MWDCIGNAAKRARVYLPPRKRWHIFRHTWASMMLQNGTDVQMLTEMVNWKTPQMPLRYATGLDRKKKKEKLNQMQVLNGTQKARKEKVVPISIRIHTK